MILGIAAAAALLCSSSAAQQPSTSALEAAYWAAHEAEAPVRGLVHLWLRIAGVIWIAAEWTAAIYLIKGFHALRRRLERESTP